MAKLKLLFLIFLTTFALYLKDFHLLMFLLLTTFSFSILFLDNERFRKRLTPLFWVLIFVTAFQILFNQSFSLQSRIFTGFITGTKIMLLSMLVFVFTETTSISQIIDMFSFLPSKFQLAITITLSFVPIILKEFDKILLIQTTRGYKTRFFSLLRNIIPVIIPLLHRTFLRAEQIALVIQSKGYDESKLV